MGFRTVRALAVAAVCTFAAGLVPPCAEAQAQVASDSTDKPAQMRPSLSDGDVVKLKLEPPKPKPAASPEPGEAAPEPSRKKTKTAIKDTGPLPASAGKEHAIVALVNDEPITAYEIDQRAVMLSGSQVGQQAKAIFEGLVKNPKTTERLKAVFAGIIKANPGKSKDQIIAIFDQKKKEFGMSLQKEAFEKARSAALPGVKKQAMDELIDEKLRLQEAKKQNAMVGDDEVNRVVEGLAQRNKMTLDEFSKQVGGNLEPLKNRVRSSLSWNEVVRRRFSAQINVNTRDIDKFVASSSKVVPEDAQLRIQRIRVAMPVKLEERGVAKRMQEAETIRAKFSDCKSMAQTVSGIAGAKFEDLGERRTSAFSEPTKSMLASASENEMLPPSVGEGWIELYAVCSKNTANSQEDQRSQAEGELKQKEFEIMSKRYLKDLRQDARIEYR